MSPSAGLSLTFVRLPVSFKREALSTELIRIGLAAAQVREVSGSYPLNLALTGDGRWMVTADDKAIEVWDMGSDYVEQLIALAARTAGRNFTAAEWKQFFPDRPFPLERLRPSAPLVPLAMSPPAR